MSTTFEVVVNSRIEAAQDIVCLELAAVAGERLPDWSAGAHIDVYTRDAAGREVARQYSLCGPAGGDTWRIAVLDGPGGRGGSKWLHENAVAGQTVRVSAPRNHFGLYEEREPVILVAGGIGLTPLLAMAWKLSDNRVPFKLFYYVRRVVGAAFLQELGEAPFSTNTVVSVDESEAGALPLRQIFDNLQPDTRLYLCGPEGFMNAVIQEGLAQGLLAHRIHRELFATDSITTQAGSNRAFDIVLKSNGRRIHVPPEQTAVQALAQAGIEVVMSCEQGLCGSCLTHVLEGVPEHRDQFMMPEEQARNDSFTPCCSRAKTACLVLDL